MITIEFTSKDPKLAASAANAVADGYLALQQQTRQQQTAGAGVWLQGEIAKLQPRVAEAEAKAEAFRSRSNLFLGTNNTTLSNQGSASSTRSSPWHGRRRWMRRRAPA